MNPLLISGLCMGLALVGIAVLTGWLWRDYVRTTE